MNVVRRQKSAIASCKFVKVKHVGLEVDSSIDSAGQRVKILGRAETIVKEVQTDDGT